MMDQKFDLSAAADRLADLPIQRHGKLRYEDGPDYCEIFDAHGEKVALTTRPDLFQALEAIVEQYEGEPIELSALRSRAAELEGALRPFAAVHAGQVAEPEKRFKKYRAALLHIRLQPIDFKLAYDALDARAALAKEPTP